MSNHRLMKTFKLCLVIPQHILSGKVLPVLPFLKIQNMRQIETNAPLSVCLHSRTCMESHPIDPISYASVGKKNYWGFYRCSAINGTVRLDLVITSDCADLKPTVIIEEDIQQDFSIRNIVDPEPENNNITNTTTEKTCSWLQAY